VSYISYEQVEADSTVKTATALTIPNLATFAMLQADTAQVRYSLDGVTAPASGKRLIPGLVPEIILIPDLKNIRFQREGGSNGNLNIHYGR